MLPQALDALSLKLRRQAAGQKRTYVASLVVESSFGLST